MNYNSVQSIFDAGAENMTAYFENTRTTSTQYLSTYVTFWKFAAKTVNTLYMYTTSMMGFGGKSYYLQFASSSYALQFASIYHEEGTLWNYHKFVKFKVIYYRPNNSSCYGNDDYKVEYDLLVFNDASMCLKLVHYGSKAITYSECTFVLKSIDGTYTYTAPTEDSPYVTFYANNSYGRSFGIYYGLIYRSCPYKYLLSQDSTYYKIADGALEELTDVTSLSASVFNTYGFVPSELTSDILKNMTNPKLYIWAQSVKTNASAKMIAIPKVQAVITDALDMNKDETITGIEEITSEYEGNPLISISINDGETWKYFNGTEWTDATDEVLGMAIDTLKSLTADQWTLLLGELKAFKIKMSISSLEDKITNIVFMFKH